jgi:hypothetical protein
MAQNDDSQEGLGLRADLGCLGFLLGVSVVGRALELRLVRGLMFETSD